MESKKNDTDFAERTGRKKDGKAITSSLVAFVNQYRKKYIFLYISDALAIPGAPFANGRIWKWLIIRVRIAFL